MNHVFFKRFSQLTCVNKKVREEFLEREIVVKGVIVRRAEILKL